MNTDLTNEDRNRSVTISKNFIVKNIIRYLNSISSNNSNDKTLFKEIVPSYSFL